MNMGIKNSKNLNILTHHFGEIGDFPEKYNQIQIFSILAATFDYFLEINCQISQYSLINLNFAIMGNIHLRKSIIEIPMIK